MASLALFYLSISEDGWLFMSDPFHSAKLPDPFCPVIDGQSIASYSQDRERFGLVNLDIPLAVGPLSALL